MGEIRALSPFAVALRQARLARALSINDVAKATLLSDKQILGLENDDYSYFYNGLFASRSADAYAAFLGVDFNLDGAPSREAVEYPKLVFSIDKTGTSKKHTKLPVLFSSSVFWSLLIGALALAYGLYSCEMIGSCEQPVAARETGSSRPMHSDNSVVSDSTFGSSDDTTPEATSVEWVPESTKVPPPIDTPTPPTELATTNIDLPEWDRDAKENRFFIIINKQTWISAKDSLNKVLIEGTPQPTTGRRVIGKKPFQIVLEDPSAVEIYYLGSRIRPGNTGNPGISVVERT